VASLADTLILLPMVTPEVVTGISLLLFFALLMGANGSILQIAVAHIAFSISYVAIMCGPGRSRSTRGWRRRPATSAPRPARPCAT